MTAAKSQPYRRYISIDIIKKTYKNWRSNRTLRLGAGLAYYGVFAAIPVITLMIGVAATIFSAEDIAAFTDTAVSDLFGGSLSTTIASITDAIVESQSNGVFNRLGIIGIGSLIVTASFIFVALQDALDTIWGKSVRTGVKTWIARYLVAYGIVLLSSTLLLVLLLVNAISSLSKYLVPGEIPVIEGIADLILSIVTWVIGAGLMAIIMRLLIYKTIPWNILLIGSILTTVLIVFGTAALGFYLSHVAYNSVGGAIGALFLMLLWVYYQSQIVLIGAQYTKTIYQQNYE